MARIRCGEDDILHLLGNTSEPQGKNPTNNLPKCGYFLGKFDQDFGLKTRRRNVTLR